MDVAIYGLLSGLVLFSVYAVGLDYYTFANRQLVGSSSEVRGQVLFAQASVYVGMYVLAGVVALGASVFGLASPALLAWGMALLVAEHLGQEMNRLLVISNHQSAASIIMFIRSGLWGLLAAGIMAVVPASRSIFVALSLWFMCAAGAFVCGAIHLYRCGWTFSVPEHNVRLVCTGLKRSLPMLLGTLAFLAVVNLDRVYVAFIADVDTVAAYTLFAGFANAMRSVLDASVHAYSLPRMLSAGRGGEVHRLRVLQRRCSIQTLAVGLLYAIVIAITCHVMLLPHLDAMYSEHFSLLLLLLLAMIGAVLGVAPQYSLFALNRDGALVMSSVVSLLLFVAVSTFVGPHASEMAVAGGMVSALFSGWLIKGVAARSALARLEKQRAAWREGIIF